MMHSTMESIDCIESFDAGLIIMMSDKFVQPHTDKVSVNLWKLEFEHCTRKSSSASRNGHITQRCTAW